MLDLVPPDIEKYVLAHTTPLPGYLRELTDFTRKNTSAPQMLSGPVEGMLLQFLVSAMGARRVLEVGTFTGFSALMMAAALPEDGKLITCDINSEAAKVARAFFKKSPHGHKIEVRVGPALETMRTLRGPFGVIFIDADKENYGAYYERALELLAPRGVIAIDNVLWSGRVLKPKDATDRAIAALNDRIRKDKRVTHVLLPIRDGVMLVRKA